jgi:hypothetical protein
MLSSDRTEVFQLYGEGSLNELSRALEGMLNQGWEMKYANLNALDSQATRFRGTYILFRVVSGYKAPEPVAKFPDEEVKVTENVVEALGKRKVKSAE